MKVERKINEVLNRLSKTRQEKTPDLRLEREQRDREERELQKQLLREKVMRVQLNVCILGMKAVLTIYEIILKQRKGAIRYTSYSTVVLYISDHGVWGFLPKNITQKPASHFLYQYWLGIVKPKNVFSKPFQQITNFQFNN